MLQNLELETSCADCADMVSNQRAPQSAHLPESAGLHSPESRGDVLQPTTCYCHGSLEIAGCAGCNSTSYASSPDFCLDGSGGGVTRKHPQHTQFFGLGASLQCSDMLRILLPAPFPNLSLGANRLESKGLAFACGIWVRIVYCSGISRLQSRPHWHIARSIAGGTKGHSGTLLIWL